ncbi:hypothetical protein [Arthrobacter sp. ISL-72]|uniref:hypothetical protein n=1 Tax=Arthrobacter sp. ISL-72 TaxID=2819114 RepID=UPI001BE779FD|nr:hypothetical protein [Arthrobacter sp. ISL-72]MBT2594253.1 hypothetical protein [Arthrobacter sp. ISL-72]
MITRDDLSGGTVDRFLLDAGHTDVPDLRAALLSIAALAQLPAPAPCPELATLLSGPQDELTRQRWLRKHRPAVVGLAVLAGMGLGVSGVAATNQATGDGTGPWSVQQLTTDWTPGWTLPVAPAAADRDGRGKRAVPLFLQLEEEPSAGDRAAEPDAQRPGPATADGGGPAGPGSEQVLPPAKGQQRVPGTTGGGANGAKRSGETLGVSRNQADPTEQSGARLLPQRGAPTAQATSAAEEGATKLGEGSIGLRGQNSRKTEESSADLLDSALDSSVDSSLDSVSSWLAKFRP